MKNTKEGNFRSFALKHSKPGKEAYGKDLIEQGITKDLKGKDIVPEKQYVQNGVCTSKQYLLKTKHVKNATRCGDCGACIGEYHIPGCDLEMCPFCGEQAMGCEHSGATIHDYRD